MFLEDLHVLVHSASPGWLGTVVDDVMGGGEGVQRCPCRTEVLWKQWRGLQTGRRDGEQDVLRPVDAIFVEDEAMG